jgi:hypothetical protein
MCKSHETIHLTPSKSVGCLFKRFFEAMRLQLISNRGVSYPGYIGNGKKAPENLSL